MALQYEPSAVTTTPITNTTLQDLAVPPSILAGLVEQDCRPMEEEGIQSVEAEGDCRPMEEGGQSVEGEGDCRPMEEGGQTVALEGEGDCRPMEEDEQSVAQAGGKGPGESAVESDEEPVDEFQGGRVMSLNRCRMEELVWAVITLAGMLGGKLGNVSFINRPGVAGAVL